MKLGSNTISNRKAFIDVKVKKRRLSFPHVFSGNPKIYRYPIKTFGYDKDEDEWR